LRELSEGEEERKKTWAHFLRRRRAHEVKGLEKKLEIA
jgi:hypothetical protein